MFKKLSLCALALCTVSYVSAENVSDVNDSVEVANPDMQSQLLEAMTQNDIVKVKSLIAAGVDVNAPFSNGFTPLLFSVVAGPQVLGDNIKEVVEILIDAGASLDLNINGEQIHMKNFVKNTINSFKSMTEKYELLLPYLEELTLEDTARTQEEK